MSLLKNKIFKNFSVLTGINIIIQILSILSSIRLARLLEPKGYGFYNVVLLQATIFSIIAGYGLRLVIIRHIARNREDAKKIFIISAQIRFFTTIIAGIFVIGYNLLNVNQPLTTLYLIVVVLIITFQTLWDTIECISFGYEKMSTSGYINLIFTFLWIAEVYLIPASSFKVNIVLYFYILNQILKTIVFYIWVNKNILKSPSIKSYKYIDFSDHKMLLKQAGFFFILSVFTTFQNQIPILLLQFNSSIDQIGLFNLGNRILSPMQLMLNTLLTSMFPMLSRLALNDTKKFTIRIKSLLNITIIAGVWASICFALFSHDFVLLLYGDAYKTAANIILTQCWYTLMFAIFCIIGTVLSALDKQKLLSILSIIYTLISFPLFYFGSKYGAMGLAISFVIAAFINMTYHWIIFRNLLQRGISIVYSFSIFSIIGILTFLTYKYEFTISILMRLILLIIITLLVISYIYKIEYTKIKFELKS
jgi:O-antigen/teichoic acid export membrane protein